MGNNVHTDIQVGDSSSTIAGDCAPADPPAVAFDAAGPLVFPFARCVALSTRADGGMGPNRAPNVERRTALARRLGFDPRRLTVVDQQHTQRVVVVDHAPGDRTREPAPADGIVTKRPGLVLAVTVADCQPIVLCDRRTGAVGIVHSGWRGTGILVEAVRCMVDRLGSTVGDIRVLLGPCISVQAYEVDQARYEQFTARFGSAAGRVGYDADGRSRWFLDLRQANRLLARQLGVAAVDDIPLCTVADRRLFSYRRDGAAAYQLMLMVVSTTAGEVWSVEPPCHPNDRRDLRQRND